MRPACVGAFAGRRGFTLVELLIALALGLLVTLAAGSLLVSASAAYIAQADGAHLDDAGRFALATIERAVRQAAFVDWERDGAGADLAIAPARFAGLDGHSVGRAGEGIEGARPGAVNGSDVLAVRYQGAGEGPIGDGSVINCAGFAVAGHADGWSIFYVALNGDGEPELRCKYRGEDNWGADAIIGGLDSFQVLYGLDTDHPADGLANSYVSATAIKALDAAIVPEGATDAARENDRRRKTHWKRVASIKVALLLHGPRRSRTDTEAVQFDLFGPAYNGAADTGTRLDENSMDDALRQRERRAFAATILVRNPSL